MDSLFARDYDLDNLERITTRAFGFDLYVTPRFRYHFSVETYEELTSRLVRQTAKGVRTFFDVGAHYGFFDVLVGLSNPQCRILAFEPVPQNVEILRTNLRLNSVDADVHQAAVSDASGQEDFQVSAASDNSGFVANPAAAVVRRITTDVVRLDDFIDFIQDGPVLMKIDAEGSELKVLGGMQQIIDEREDVRLVIEFNPRCLDANGADPDALLDQLDRLGFDVHFVLDSERQYAKHGPGKHWQDYMGGKTNRNLFCVKKGLSLNLCVFSHGAQLCGAERSLLELVDSMIQRYGTVFTVLLPADGPLQPRLETLGAATILGDYQWWCSYAPSTEKAAVEDLMLTSWDSVDAASPALLRLSPDVVLTNSLVIPWGAAMAAKLGRPHIWWVKEFGELDHGLDFYYTHKKTLQIVEQSSNHIVVNSEAVRKALFGSVGSDRCSTAANLVTLGPPDDSPGGYFRFPDSTKLVICGNVGESKGQEDAVRATIKLARDGYDVELCVAGTMPPAAAYSRELRALVRHARLKKRIHFLQFLESIRPLVEEAQISLTCSRNEAFGRTAAEAMLLGKPVIGTNTGGTPELIEDGVSGFLYTPGDVDRLADRIAYFAEKPEALQEFGERARRAILARLATNPVDSRMFELCQEYKHGGNPHSPELAQLLQDWQLGSLARSEARPRRGERQPRLTGRLRGRLAGRTARFMSVWVSAAQRFQDTTRLVGRQARRLARSARHGGVRRSAAKVARLVAPGFMRWRARHRTPAQSASSPPDGRSDPLLLAAEARHLEYRPLVSILVPVYNTAPQYLRLAVDSVLAQAYPEWELILCDDGSTKGATRAALKEVALLDKRIHLRSLGANHGIATATNAALAEARGEFVAMLDHDDELLPATLLDVVKALNADRTLDVVYTDQDCMEADGRFTTAFYKPDWSLEMFRGVMYVGHLLVVRRSLADAVGGFDPAFDHVQDFEFMLRLAEKTERIAHVPEILYHWRKIPGSVAFSGHAKKDIEPLQAAAVNAHLARCGIEATARSNPEHEHRLLITPRPRTQHPVATVVIRASGSEAHLQRTCERIRSGSSYPNRELIVTGGDISDALAGRLKAMGITLEAPGKTGSAAFLVGLERANGHLIVSIAGDLEVQTSDWLEHLLFGCELPGVGCVTPLIISSDGAVSSAGLILGGARVVIPAMRGWQPATDGYAGSLSCAREVSAVPGDCYAVTRQVLHDLGGLNPYLASDHYQAVDLSLRARSAGLRNLYTPRVAVRRLGPDSDEEQRDVLDELLLAEAWQPLTNKGDPFHNRNFEQVAPGYRA